MLEIKSNLASIVSNIYLRFIDTKGLDFSILNPRLLAKYPGKNLQSMIARQEISCAFQEMGEEFFPQFLEDGRPFIIPGKYFSLSHSRNFVFTGISKTYKIGVDVECVRPRDPLVYSLHSQKEYEMMDVYSKFSTLSFAPGEKVSIVSGDRLKWNQFYRLWTIKEAVLKLFLSGLDSINEISFDECMYLSERCVFTCCIPSISGDNSIFNKGGYMREISFDIVVSGVFQGRSFLCISGMSEPYGVAKALAIEVS